jgi:hypothetical protein
MTWRRVLSWDGRYLLDTNGPEFGAYVYDVATGHRVELRKVSADAWTPDEHVFATDPYTRPPRLAVCSPATGRCVRHPMPPTRPSGSELIVGGQWSQ